MPDYKTIIVRFILIPCQLYLIQPYAPPHFNKYFLLISKQWKSFTDKPVPRPPPRPPKMAVVDKWSLFIYTVKIRNGSPKRRLL